MVKYLVAIVLMSVAVATIDFSASAGEQHKLIPEYPAGVAIPTDPELKNLNWNRYTTKNFTILSTEDSQGKYLSENIEHIKSWIYARWGLNDQDFSKECRVLCVPNRILCKKLFGMEDSKVEFRNDMSVMWLILDDRPSRTVPHALTEVCLVEYEKMNSVKFGWWAHRGMARLNGHLGDIRADLGYLYGSLKADEPMFWSKSLFHTTHAQYHKLKIDQRLLYDRQAETMCLLIRKEYGQVKFHEFISERANYEFALQKNLGFRDYAHFDSTFKRYMIDLSTDVLRSRTPDVYLEIKAVKPR